MNNEKFDNENINQVTKYEYPADAPDILRLDEIMEESEAKLPKERKKFVKMSGASREAMKASIVGMIKAGLSYWELMDQIRVRWGLEYAQASKYLSVVRDQLHVDYLKFAENVAETNINTLTQIRNENMMKGNHKLALAAVDLLNKMTQQYEKKIDLNVTTDAPIEVNFKD